jgi:tetratricopeptide (TPR) repeat protein
VTPVPTAEQINTIRQLDPEPARVFRLLGLHPVPEFSTPAVAALTALDVDRTARVLEGLVEHHLLEPVAPHRFRMHDLLHDYLADLEEPQQARDEAITRMLGWYAAMADAADRLVYPVSARLWIDLPAVETPMRDREEALAWLRSEQAALSGAQRVAAHHEMHPVVIALAVSSRHLGTGPRAWWPEELAAKTRGVDAARLAGDQAAEAFLLALRGHSHRSAGDHAEAEADFLALATLAEDTGDPVLRRRASAGMASLRKEQGRHDEAAELYLAMWEETRHEGNTSAEAVALGNLCLVNVARGRFAEALDHAQRAWELRSRTGNPLITAYAEDDLALARQGLGEHDTAIALWETVAEVYARHAGEETHLAAALEAKAASLLATGRPEDAAHDLRLAAEILAGLGDPRAELVLRRAADLVPPDGDAQP